MSFKAFLKELGGNRAEGELLTTILLSLITSAAVFASVYFFFLRDAEAFTSQRSLFVLFAMLSYALILPALRQVRSYQQFGCMPGMMIGMTLGMISGFLAGYAVGATNGLFVGGVWGMAVGITFGVWNGKCCGVMGILEGLMAGFMGGLMGAMTAVMLLNDHLIAAAWIVLAICAVILGGLHYMSYLEMREQERQKKEDSFLTVLLSLVLTSVTIWLIVFGPRSPLFG